MSDLGICGRHHHDDPAVISIQGRCDAIPGIVESAPPPVRVSAQSHHVSFRICTLKSIWGKGAVGRAGIWSMSTMSTMSVRWKSEVGSMEANASRCNDQKTGSSLPITR